MIVINKWQQLDVSQRLLIYISIVVTVGFICSRLEGTL